jgi:hypothetical protein
MLAGPDPRERNFHDRLPGNTLGSFVFAPAPFSTPYTVTLSVQDWSFSTLASRSASITTKKPQQGSL